MTGGRPRLRSGPSRQLVVGAISLAWLHLAGQGRAAGTGRTVRTPWFFDCSHHPEWNSFRQRFVEFRHRFGTEDKDSPELIDSVSRILLEANDLGRRTEGTFVQWGSSWDIFHLCDEEQAKQVPQGLKEDFCFYGFVVVQWLGLFGHKHFGAVPGMAEWAHNARGFLNDASKFNSMHFLESSGWPVKLVELAQALSITYLGSSLYRPARDAALPRGSADGGPSRRSPAHTRVAGALPLRAVAISYHAALLREPLSVWLRLLRHRFHVEADVHILDATAQTPEDVRKLHSHCQFIDGAWCKSDERLLKLNELFDSMVLSCHTGDHKTRHHFLKDADAYYQLFVDLFRHDETMLAADLFMCGEPVFFCKLLSFFGQPVVGYISTPLSVYVNAADRPKWYSDFYEMALDGRHFFAATTPIFAEWIAYATGISLPVIRPICLYTEATYWPTRAREVLLLRTVSLFWDSECVFNYFARETARAVAMANLTDVAAATPIRFRESTSLTGKERVGYSAFAEFLAAVILPYAFSQFWFYELYAMAVPIFMPARDTLPLFVNQDYATCPDFEGHRPGHFPHLVHEHSPFDADDWDAMTYWTQFTDYLLTPHVEYFESVPELLWMLESGDHRQRSRDMQRVQAERVGQATTFWADVLDAIASLRDLRRGRGAEGEEGGDERPIEALSDELRDLSTRQPCGGSPHRHDGPPRLANDGDTRQYHPHEYHFDAVHGGDAGGRPGTSHWWVRLRRVARDPQVRIWPRDCCHEAFGHRLWLLLGNSSRAAEAAECGAVEVNSSEVVSAICHGVGEYLFVEARPEGGWGYQDADGAVLMLPEVRVLSRD